MQKAIGLLALGLILVGGAPAFAQVTGALLSVTQSHMS
jgi:hypothetical protein